MRSGKFVKILYIRLTAKGQERYRLYGQTVDGRYLFVVLERLKGTVYRPITAARDMTDVEKRSFRRLRK